MNLQENIRRILREELNESLFFRRRVDMDLLNKRAFENLNHATDTFLKRYNQGKKFKFSQFKSVVIDYLMDDYHNELSKGGSKDFPYDEVYEFLSKYYHDKIKDRYELMFGGNINESKDKLNENWHEVPSSEYNSLQNIINLVMKEKYGWWKDIKINTLNYIKTYGHVHIEAELTVDEEWGANQWGEFYYSREFPGNKGWEDDGYEVVRFGDIIDSTYAEVIRHDLKELLKYTLNIDANNISFLYVYLIFE